MPYIPKNVGEVTEIKAFISQASRPESLWTFKKTVSVLHQERLADGPGIASEATPFVEIIKSKKLRSTGNNRDINCYVVNAVPE
jgi:hypothetical protein